MTTEQTISVGQIFRSNDPRDVNRGTYQVTSIGPEQAVLTRTASDWTRVSFARLHMDNEPRRSGWSIVHAD